MNDETRRKFLIRSIGTLGATIPIIYYGCDTGGTRGGPLGPSGAGVFTAPVTSITIIPPSVTLIKGASQTFTATGGAGAPYTWSLSDTALGTIGVSTGVFTAGATAGTLSVRASDSAGATGATGSGAVTIITPTILVTPAVATIPNLPIPTVAAPATVTFTATGGTAPYTYNLSTITDATLVAAIVLATGVLSVTVAPTADETLTVTATDAFGDTGTSSVTVQA